MKACDLNLKSRVYQVVKKEDFRILEMGICRLEKLGEMKMCVTPLEKEEEEFVGYAKATKFSYKDDLLFFDKLEAEKYRTNLIDEEIYRLTLLKTEKI